MIKIITRIQTVLFKILIDFGTVFSEIKALKSFNCLKSSFTDAANLSKINQEYEKKCNLKYLTISRFYPYPLHLDFLFLCPFLSHLFLCRHLFLLFNLNFNQIYKKKTM